MNILLISDVNYNVGDYFIREGVIHLLETALSDTEIHFDIMGMHEAEYIRSPEGQRILERADLGVQAGMPFFWNQNYSIHPTFKKIPIPFAKRVEYKTTPKIMAATDALWKDGLIRLGTRCALLGIGSVQPYHDTAKDIYSPELLQFAKETASNAVAISVRDNMTSDFLDMCEIPHVKLTCPSIFARKRLHPGSGEKRYVVINYMDGGGPYHFDYRINKRAWRKTMVNFRSWLEEEKKEQVVFSCHNQDDLDLTRDHFKGADTFFSKDYRDYL